jgi:uncharacterized protein
MKTSAALLLVAMAVTATGCAKTAKPSADACHMGLYRMADGSILDLTPTTDGPLRWRRMDGTTGRLSQKDGAWVSTMGWSEDRTDGKRFTLGPCGVGRITVDGVPGQRQSFDVTETTFQSGDVTLAGRLVLPKGSGPVPITVLVHGSEDYSARDFSADQRMLPAGGVGVFVYDKRGTGGSTGKYTQDFDLLSDDAVAAVKEARRLAGARAGRLGLRGASQGGWVAPYAATKTRVDYVIAAYGMTVSPLEENRSETIQDLAMKGYGPDIQAKGGEVADAAGEVIAQGFQGGYEPLLALKEKYGKEAWFKDLGGEFTGQLVKYPPFALRIVGPMIDKGTSWRYRPLDVLRKVDVPMLWIVAAEDTAAPPEQTLKDLAMLTGEGRPITTLVFPGTDHGIVAFDTAKDGDRIRTRYAAGYFDLTRDYAADGVLRGPYGNAKVAAAGAMQ